MSTSLERVKFIECRFRVPAMDSNNMFVKNHGYAF